MPFTIMQKDLEEKLIGVNSVTLLQERLINYGKIPRKSVQWMMRAKYGIEPEDFENMNTRCGGLCEICGGEPTTYQGFKTLCVDHCHTTGKVRGLLCNKCNQALGLFQDSIENLLSAVEYLKERSEIH